MWNFKKIKRKSFIFFIVCLWFASVVLRVRRKLVISRTTPPMCFLPYTGERKLAAAVYMCFADGGYKQLIAGAVKRSIQQKFSWKKKEHNNFFLRWCIGMSNTTLLNTHTKKKLCLIRRRVNIIICFFFLHDQRWTQSRWSNASKKNKKNKPKKEYRTSLGSVRQAVCLHKPKRRRRGAKDGVHARTNLRNKTRESGRSFFRIGRIGSRETTTNHPPTHASNVHTWLYSSKTLFFFSLLLLFRTSDEGAEQTIHRETSENANHKRYWLCKLTKTSHHLFLQVKKRGGGESFNSIQWPWIGDGVQF